MADFIDEAVATIRRLGYKDAAVGKELYYFMGISVLEHTTPGGHVLALKVKPTASLAHSEADMMHHAATNKVLAPLVRGCYDIVTMKPSRPIARVIAADRVRGVPLDMVWERFTDADKASVKQQLQKQLALMRACTQPYIGRVNRQPTRNVYDRLQQTYCGPFDDEKAFDRWCLDRHEGGPLTRWKWKRVIQRLRRESSARFVLTHGDLTPRNIMVDGAVVTGIVDWERSGFFPEYCEYAFAMRLCHEHEAWWLPVLKELLRPCCEQRLEFTGLVEDRGW